MDSTLQLDVVSYSGDNRLVNCPTHHCCTYLPRRNGFANELCRLKLPVLSKNSSRFLETKGQPFNPIPYICGIPQGIACKSFSKCNNCTAHTEGFLLLFALHRLIFAISDAFHYTVAQGASKTCQDNKTEIITLHFNPYNINWESLEMCSIMKVEMTDAINDCVSETLLEVVNV